MRYSTDDQLDATHKALMRAEEIKYWRRMGERYGRSYDDYVESKMAEKEENDARLANRL